MWCCQLARVPQLFCQTAQKRILAGSQCCAGAFSRRDRGHYSAGSQHTFRCKHGQTYQRWSKSYLAFVAAGVGLSVATYKLLSESDILYAAEEETAETKTEATDGETEKGDEKAEEQTQERDWSKVPELPAHVPYILIGGGTASLEAFKAIKISDMYAKVLMITEEQHSPYYRPILSKEFFFDDNQELYKEQKYTSVRGKINSIYQSEGLFMEPKKLPYSERGGCGLLQGKKVIRLDPVAKTVTLDDGRKIGFDKCLIATGGRPRNLEIFENAAPEVKERTTLFRNYEDAAKLLDLVKKSQSVAVIGGGFLGSELAIGLAHRGKQTGSRIYQAYPEKGVFGKVLPDYLSDWTTKKLQKEGVTAVPMVELFTVSYEEEEDKVRLVLTNGQVLLVDQVVVAVGLEPNTELARMAGLEVDKKLGGYVVNAELQARTGVWAAGDCACFYDTKLGRRRVEHFEHAAMTGRLAGLNMAGESNTFKYQSIFWSTLGRILNYEAVGLIDSDLKTFATFLPPDAQPTQHIEGVALDADVLPEEFTKGVIFYLRDDIIVGVVLWNLDSFSGSPSRMDIAKQIIQNGAKGENLLEVAKLFTIHSKPKPLAELEEDKNETEKDKKETPEENKAKS